MKRDFLFSVLFSFYLLLMVLPFIQSRLHIIISKELKGDFYSTEYKPFTFKSWFENSYQQNTEKYISEHIGFGSDFVRLNNQVDFSFFKYTNCDVIIGKEGYLYQKGYIESKNGMDIITSYAADSLAYKLRYITEQLKNNNTDLILVIPPSKTNYYYEKIPDYLIKKNRGNTNYELIINRLDRKSTRLNSSHVSESRMPSSA